MSNNIQTIAVLGMGLMGGSLCLALRKRGFTGQIRVYARRSETLDQALAMQCCDQAYENAAEAVRGTDIAVVCLPVLKIPALAYTIMSAMSEGAILTDVGSTKQFLHNELDVLLAAQGIHYVGSHPIAGSEKSGLDSARADLYENALCVLTRSHLTNESALMRVRSLWEAAGCRVHVMAPDQHDLLLARTSHLPHLLSAALARVVAREKEPVSLCCGSGYRDMTRLAEGSPEVWQDIVRSNRPAIARELAAMRSELDRLQQFVEGQEDIRNYLEQARTLRRETLQNNESAGFL